MVSILSLLLGGTNGQSRGGPCVELGQFNIPVGSSINGLTHVSRDDDGRGTISDQFTTGTDPKTPGPDPDNMQFKVRTIATSVKNDDIIVSQTQYFLNNQPIGPSPKGGNFVYRISYKHIPGFTEKDDKLFYLDDMNTCYATVRDIVSPHLPRVSVYGLPADY